MAKGGLEHRAGASLPDVHASTLAQALDVLPDAVTIQDLHGRVLYANAASLEFMGLRDRDEIASVPMGDVRRAIGLCHEDGRPVEIEELPGRRALATGRPQELVVRTVVPDTGAERWSRIKATPLRDAAGQMVGAINVVDDLTAEKRAEREQRFLAGAAELLGSSLDYEETLQAVARMAVPGLADWCGVDLLDERGDVQLVAVAHRDPAKVELARELRARYPADLGTEAGLGGAIRHGAITLVPEVRPEQIAASARDDEHLRMLEAIGFHSVIVVPMAVGERILGAVTFVNSESGRRFGEADVELAQELGRRAATAIEQSRLFTERKRIAGALQHALLPGGLIEVPGWTAAALFRPAGVANEVGGDFYDLVELPDGGHVAVIGDVAGKGATAAALTARARHTLITAMALTADEHTAFARLDAALREETDEGLVSAALARLGTGGASVTCAGHPLPVRVRGEEAEIVGRPGPLLGGDEGSSWQPAQVELDPGDGLVLVTDGVLDAVGEHERFGTGRLLEALTGPPAEHASVLVERLRDALERFQVGPQRDDIAVLALVRRRRRP